ncbi:hypothetical protein EYF80_050547 [Liparis tanakae]|uniref:Uncharacterized protein n=1 Tax=Liparis tanakae TaxID=230148 RepID=A0A4Z2FDN8_9TELE|nr:hypothetical protein EYF80_050547 [Liparis tanakae]
MLAQSAVDIADAPASNMDASLTRSGSSFARRASAMFPLGSLKSQKINTEVNTGIRIHNRELLVGSQNTSDRTSTGREKREKERITEVWIVEYADYQLRHGPVDAPPTPPLYLHLPDGARRSGSWSMPTTNYSYTVIFIECVFFYSNLSFWSHDIYCSLHPGEGSSSVPDPM